MSSKKLFGLLSGGASILLWSVSACLFYLLNNLPLFQVLSIVMVTGGITGMLIEREKYTVKNIFTYLRNDWMFTAVLLVNSICYALAFRLAPAAHVDLINYTWPIMLVVGESIRVGKRLRKLQIIGICVCFLGVIVLLLPTLVETKISSEYLVGYLASMCAAITWATYSILGNHKPRKCDETGGISVDVLALGVLFGAFQWGYDGFQSISLGEWGILLPLGVLVYGCAFLLWNRSLLSGQSTIVGGMANMIPILSIGWLVVLGVVDVSYALVISTFFVAFGCYLLQKQKAAIKHYTVMDYLDSEFSECG